MSTTTKMFDDEELADLVAELKAWPNTGSGDDEQELTVSPFITFYFLYDTKQWIETSLLMVDIHEKFEQMMEYPYLIGTHPTSERPHPYGSKRLPDLREFARKTKKGESFMFSVTNEKNNQSSPTNAGYFWKKKDYMNDMADPTNKVYSTIQFYYRWGWWKENMDAWRGFVLETIDKLKPEVVYNGFAMATPLEFGTRSAVTVWERALAPHFYGLDIDDPWAMDGQGDGIRPPTWGFLLSDTWRSKLDMSREQVKDQLHHPEISIIEIDTGLWIELGHEPSLFPVEEGVPELLKLLNRLIRPIRNDHTDLLGFAQWDGDPNVRFNKEDSMRWLQRFDDDSDWPSIEQRRVSLGATLDPSPQLDISELRAKAGSPCPKTGTWQSIDPQERRQHFELGEPMGNLESNYGLTVWRYLGN